MDDQNKRSSNNDIHLLLIIKELEKQNANLEKAIKKLSPISICFMIILVLFIITMLVELFS